MLFKPLAIARPIITQAKLVVLRKGISLSIIITEIINETIGRYL